MPEACDAVFHIAANTNLWSGGNAEQTRDNVDGTRNVVEAAIAKGAKKLVHTSTAVGTWGEVHESPFDEKTPQHGGESSINYERTKYLAEVEVFKGIERGLHACIMCPGHIVGRYDTHNWATVIKLVATEKLPGVPPGQGTWAAAGEVARAHVAAVEKGRDGERYLLGGVDASYLEAVQSSRASPAGRSRRRPPRGGCCAPSAACPSGALTSRAGADNHSRARRQHHSPAAPVQERQGDPRARLPRRPAGSDAGRRLRVAQEREARPDRVTLAH